MSNRVLFSVAGKLSFVSSQHNFGRATLRSLLRLAHAVRLDTMVKLSLEVIEDLTLTRLLMLQRPMRTQLPRNVKFLLTDASGIDGAGYMMVDGAHGMGRVVQFGWSRFPRHLLLQAATEDGKTASTAELSGGGHGQEDKCRLGGERQQASSTLLEVMGAALALAASIESERQATIIMICDSQSAVHSLNKMYSKGVYTNQILKFMGGLLCFADATLRVVHRSREHLSAVDCLSHGDLEGFHRCVSGPRPELPVEASRRVRELLMDQCPSTPMILEYLASCK